MKKGADVHPSILFRRNIKKRRKRAHARLIHGTKHVKKHPTVRRVIPPVIPMKAPIVKKTRWQKIKDFIRKLFKK